jgi:hypothetical protein
VLSRLLGLALLVACLGVLAASCGGSEEVASRNGGDGSQATTDRSPTTTETDSEESTSTAEEGDDEEGDDDEGGPSNPTFRRGKLRKGDCTSVKEETEEVLQQSSDEAALAEARLYHGLATALCLGDANAAEQEIEEVDADRLSPESRQVLEQVNQKGVPRTTAELQNVLRAAAIAPPPAGTKG